MFRVTSLVSAAIILLAAVEGVITESQEHFGDSSVFQDTCTQIRKSISNASVVYRSRETSITLPRSSLADSTPINQPHGIIT